MTRHFSASALAAALVLTAGTGAMAGGAKAGARPLEPTVGGALILGSARVPAIPRKSQKKRRKLRRNR